MRGQILAAAAAALAFLVVAACVGDDPDSETTPGLDAAGAGDNDQPFGDGATSDSATNDTSVADAGGDVRCNPTSAFGTPELVAELSTGPRIEGFGIVLDGNTAFFSTVRDGGPGFLDIYATTRSSATTAWGNIVLVKNVNLAGADYWPSVSGDGKLLLFSSDRAGYQIFRSTRSSLVEDFGTPMPFDELNDAGAGEIPFVRYDGQVVYFDRGVANAKRDLFRSVASAGLFGVPTAVTELNTTDEESGVTATYDDLVIYWASTRPGGGGGGYDVWMATRDDVIDAFVNVAPVGALNTSAEEKPTYVSDDRCTLYFTRGPTTNRLLYVAKKTP